MFTPKLIKHTVFAIAFVVALLFNSITPAFAQSGLNRANGSWDNSSEIAVPDYVSIDGEESEHKNVNVRLHGNPKHAEGVNKLLAENLINAKTVNILVDGKLIDSDKISAALSSKALEVNGVTESLQKAFPGTCYTVYEAIFIDIWVIEYEDGTIEIYVEVTIEYWIIGPYPC